MNTHDITVNDGAQQIPYKVGSFWTSRQRQGHSLHEVSYRACFKPQLVEYFINRLTNEGDIVLDPFMGRGTTILESVLHNRIAYGSDINPLSEMLLSPRLSPPPLEDVLHRLRDIPTTSDIPNECMELLVFYHEDTLMHLLAMKKWFSERLSTGEFDIIDSWIRMVAINRLTGHSPGFLSVRTMPPNQAISAKKQAELNKKHNNTPSKKDVVEILMKKSKSLLRSGAPNKEQKHKLACDSAERLSYISCGEIDLIVTSPPFLDIVDYAKDNWLRCWFGDINIDTVKIDTHRSVESWSDFVNRVFMTFARVVKRGGHVAFEVGDVRNGTIMLDEVVIDALRGLPFRVNEVVVNSQNFTKTANCWGISNNGSGTLTNRIVIAEKL